MSVQPARPGGQAIEVPGELQAAVAQDLMALCVLHDRELDAATVIDLKRSGFPSGMGLRLNSERSRAALDLLREGIAWIPDAPGRQVVDELAADYADIYLTHGLRASPYESVWIDEEGLAMQEPMFQIREHYRRHGLAAANWRQRSDDHLVLQLQFVSHLLGSASDASGLVEAARFLDEHLLRWIENFGTRVAARCATPFYAGLALLTAAYLDELRELLVELAGETRPGAEEVEARLRHTAVVAVPAPSAFVPGAAPSW